MKGTPALFSAGKNLFDVILKLPKNGVGSVVRRKHWPHQSHWTISNVSLSVKPSVDGQNHGKAWGSFTWLGVKKNVDPVKVRGAHKKVWTIYDPAIHSQPKGASAAQQAAAAPSEAPLHVSAGEAAAAAG